MREWPPIDEPELLARLALDDEGFYAAARRISEMWGKREYTPALLERALGYPWERPTGSYLLRGDRVDLLSDADASERESIVETFTKDRHPILSFGGNGAPEWLTTKFAHFWEEENKEVLVLTGELHDVDVGASASVSPLGYMPGTLFASPGTAVRAAMVWCTTAQLTQLTWSEVPYQLGRLEDALFVMDDADVEVEQVFAYVSRFGAFCVDGQPIALAAVPAKNRTARALTQEDLLDLVAPRLLGRAAGAEELVRATWEDMAAVTARASKILWPCSQPLQAHWTPFPASA
ncbi:MAG TPA: hypothetical protein VEX36_06965 [Thermoleophilaceae bacterium]|nr:hypothetical protein [Thermoleophilaceae bacterium]